VVFANSDQMASGTINVLHERGLRVPQDVSVMGYDDLSIAMYTSPSLTTVRQKIPQVGELLVKNLIRNIETGMATNNTIPAELVVRQSA
jgi:DNA-binding LacI/PurR family transcriptional regulator